MSTTCIVNCWPESMTFQMAPMPSALNASLACWPIHWLSQLVIIRNPVKAVRIEMMNASTPVIQVQPLPPRHALMKKLNMKCTAMKRNMAWTLQK